MPTDDDKDPRPDEDVARLAAAYNRHRAAQHAMQAGVALDQLRRAETAKHLRVGVNTALVDHSALVRLLIAKGVITDLEYATAIADGMEEEVRRYERLLDLGPNVHLGSRGGES